jgi:hypothetical protein
MASLQVPQPALRSAPRLALRHRATHPPAITRLIIATRRPITSRPPGNQRDTGKADSHREQPRHDMSRRLFRDSRHPLREAHLGLFSRLLDPEPGDVEGGKEEEGQQGRDEEAADDSKGLNHQQMVILTFC